MKALQRLSSPPFHCPRQALPPISYIWGRARGALHWNPCSKKEERHHSSSLTHWLIHLVGESVGIRSSRWLKADNEKTQVRTMWLLSSALFTWSTKRESHHFIPSCLPCFQDPFLNHDLPLATQRGCLPVVMIRMTKKWGLRPCCSHPLRTGSIRANPPGWCKG